ncbi:unnamed protein product [Nesidiocoris tenuis]|uniref:Uncharacterized protein n=1 Tax=Nesidiocoris tenuis TaxID=355587 RepID=A0A6H5GFQ5_9HEMI|nr:unnamed protein product [Nesidiocoris tenuis]
MRKYMERNVMPGAEKRRRSSSSWKSRRWPANEREQSRVADQAAAHSFGASIEPPYRQAVQLNFLYCVLLVLEVPMHYPIAGGGEFENPEFQLASYIAKCLSHDFQLVRFCKIPACKLIRCGVGRGKMAGWRLRSGTGTRKARLAASGLQRRIKLGKWKGKKVRKLMYSRNTGGVRAVKINTILRSSHAVSLLYKVGSEWSQTALPLIL